VNLYEHPGTQNRRPEPQQLMQTAPLVEMARC